MFRRTFVGSNSADAMYKFIDPAYLNNKRPAIPGGEWTKDLLRRKSIGDLQQIWYALLQEKNMLMSMKAHYTKHAEELGAMPAPSRITMVKDSMDNIRAVMQERDFEATDRAVKVFKERMASGVYRYPPGPQLPPKHNDDSSTVVLTVSHHIQESRIRELLARPDVFEGHGGLVSVTVDLPEDVLEAKKAAEVAFDEHKWQKSDSEQYSQWNIESAYDHCEVEVAPGEFPEDLTAARDVAVPSPKKAANPPMNTLDRLKWQDRSPLEKANIQLDSFPNVTMEAPPPPGPQPPHPDDIVGPWKVTIVFDRPDGLEYVKGLQLSNIDGSNIVAVDEVDSSLPFADGCPVYNEVVEEHKADQQFQKTFPHVPEWKSSWPRVLRRSLSDIIAYNFNNVFDYTEREVLLTGKSVWKAPVEVDFSCGKAHNVPPHAKPPTYTIAKPNERSDTY